MTLRWPPIVEAARRFVEAQPIPPDLRDTHYYLAGRQIVPNTSYAYKRLSEVTAPLRRSGDFPDFAEDVRWIDEPLTFDGPDDARRWLVDNYQTDRTREQDVSVFLLSEKNGMVARLRSWFDEEGFPVVGLRGVASATIEKKVNRRIAAYDRPAVGVYMGDFDPTGVFVPRDFERHTDFAKFIRVGVNEDQVEEFGLLESITPQTDKDTRTPAFVAEFGRVRQVEMNAMGFDLVEAIYRDAVAQFWDPDAHEDALAREAEERHQLGS
jgi:hypothetical protein